MIYIHFRKYYFWIFKYPVVMYIFISVTLLAKRKRLGFGISHLYISFYCPSELEFFEKEVFQ